MQDLVSLAQACMTAADAYKNARDAREIAEADLTTKKDAEVQAQSAWQAAVSNLVAAAQTAP
jgi:hypothetical protein